MNADQIKDGFTEGGNRKTMLGVRLFHELKHKLTEEAKERGITLSEYCENILALNEAVSTEKLILIQDLEQSQANLLLFTENMSKEKAQHKLEIVKAQMEISQLKKQVEDTKPQLALVNHERLLFLFNQLKGKKDSINLPDGKLREFLYEEPKDLLEAMILSFTIK